jgi:hypothetical protein
VDFNEREDSERDSKARCWLISERVSSNFPWHSQHLVPSLKKLGIVNREQAGKKFEPINNPVRPHVNRFWSAESEDLDMLMDQCAHP